MTFELQTAHCSHVGGRKRNEDAFAYWSSDAGCCWVVSDGAGGHGSGDLASRLVVGTVIEQFCRNPQVSSECVASLLQAAQTAVIDAKACGAADMHATCVILLIDRQTGQAVWGHVGDSRLYLFREGQLCYQTRDHSLVQNMIDAGYGSVEMIRTHPNRNLLTSAIGNSGELETTVSDKLFPLVAGDTFLMCSDGWWEYVNEERMAQTLREGKPLQSWLDDMAGIVAREADASNDNYTAIGVTVEHVETHDEEDDEVTVILLPKDTKQEPETEAVK